MLSVLCHYHLGHVRTEKFKLQYLHLRRHSIPFEMSHTNEITFQEITWQILGMCAEIIGKYDEAYQSYVQAYRSPRTYLQDNAPLLRVICLIYKLLQK
jgi:hypothetical protein